MADWFGSQKKGQVGWPELAWRNYAQGSMHYQVTASGVVTATLTTGAGYILKGVQVDVGGLNGAATIVVVGADNQTFGSGGLIGWTPCWIRSGGVIALTTATAQAIGLLIGTGLPPFEF